MCLAALLGLGASEQRPRSSRRGVPAPGAAASLREPAPGGTPAAASELFSQGRFPIATGRQPTANLGASACGACHPATHQAWSTSAHRSAWNNPNFQRALAREPLPWCKNCHAPLAAQTLTGGVETTEGVSLDEGITCAVCHVRGGEVLGAKTLRAAPGRHAVRAIADFATPQLCAGCHEFAFPRHTTAHPAPGAPAVEYSDEKMQSTISEWRAASAADCSQCHSSGHQWTGPSAPGWLEAQFGDGQLLASGDQVLSLAIELAERGHALPTGDPFHSLELEIALDPEFRSLWHRQRYGREFDGVMLASEYIAGGQSHDTRISADRSYLSCSFDQPPQAPIFARLRYFEYDRWVNGQRSAETGSARIVWSQRFDSLPLKGSK